MISRQRIPIVVVGLTTRRLPGGGANSAATSRQKYGASYYLTSSDTLLSPGHSWLDRHRLTEVILHLTTYSSEERKRLST